MTSDAQADAQAEALLAPWDGPYGGLPPFDRATPAAIEHAVVIGIERRRDDVQAITATADAPTFENTILALERSGAALARATTLLNVFRTTMNTGEMIAVGARVLPLIARSDDAILHDAALFARIEAVRDAHLARPLRAMEARLLAVTRDRMRRGGAGLPFEDKARLEAINARLAELQARFASNLTRVPEQQAYILEHEDDLEGLAPALRETARQAATERGRADAWAIVNTFEMVWPFLTQSPRRDLREAVWRMGDRRCIEDGELDTRPLAAEMVALRAQKAGLLGFPSFAHFTMADRMAGEPASALALLGRVWEPVKAATVAQFAELQALADAKGARITLAPWDRRFYAEKLRRAHFNLDAETLKPYLAIENVLAAMFEAATRLLGITVREIAGVAVCYPSVRLFELARGGEPVGVLYLDVVPRAGKGRGSWQMQYRAAEAGRVLPIASFCSNPSAPVDGGPTLLGWEHANVFFHEFGHALHMLISRAPYRSLGSETVAWDFIELPSLLNERWLFDRELLQRHCRHHQSGEPIPAELLDALEAGLRYDRVFTLTCDAVASAIVDLKLHGIAPGEACDPMQVEAETLAELGMPFAADLIQHAAASFHLFAGGYAAAFYTYLWSDVMAADVADAFLRSPAGLYDAATAKRYVDTILSVGNTVPAAQAFRDFLGRDPDPSALLRRFDLVG